MRFPSHIQLVSEVRSSQKDIVIQVFKALLDEMGITLNRNAIPFDPRSPFITSGIRIGTPAVTTAGMKQEQMVTLGNAIVEILRKRHDPPVLEHLRAMVSELSDAFPAYPVEFNGYV